MKSIMDYIVESAAEKIEAANYRLEEKFGINVLDYYMFIQDELDEDSSEKEINKWIDDQIEQVVIDIHNNDKTMDDFIRSRDLKTFISNFAKEYKEEPCFDIAVRFYNKLSVSLDDFKKNTK